MKKFLSLMIIGSLISSGFLVGASRNVEERNYNSNIKQSMVISLDFQQEDEIQFIMTTEGVRIDIEGFSYLSVIGKPMLPVKNLLIALPSGCTFENVEVTAFYPVELPGLYDIMPYPMIYPLDMDRSLVESIQSEWYKNNENTYSANDVYPEEIVNLETVGSLRKYSYVSLSFCPFRYYPMSGRLFYIDSCEIVIQYTTASGKGNSQIIEDMNKDTLFDSKASSLFINFDQIKEFYQPNDIVLSSTFDSFEYVVITSDDFVDLVSNSDFISWKTDLGFNVKIITLSDELITSQPGIDLAEQIRNFLREYYISWGVQYVLIVGDYTTIPMRYCSPNPDNLYGTVPTDSYYADLSYPDSESWNSNGDSFYGVYGQDNPDFLAEVYVGRIPTSDISRLAYTLNKIVTFEQDTGGWKNNALHGGAMLFYAHEDHDPDIDFDIDGARLVDFIENDLMNGWTTSHYSEHEGLSPSVYPFDPLTEQAFTADWRNNQYAVVNWAAHGAPSSIGRVIWDWDDGDGIPEHENGELIWGRFLDTYSNLEGDYPSIVFAVSCNVGHPEPDPDGNLGIDLLTKESFGAAVAVCSATRGAAVSVNWTETHAGAEALCYEFNHYMINGPSGPERVGNALYDSKFYVHHNFGWDHYYEYQNMFCFNLYGDPSLIQKGTSGNIPEVDVIKPEPALYLANIKLLPFFTPIIIGKIDIEVEALANEGAIDYIEIFINDELKATLNSDPYTWRWNERVFGTKTILVKAYNQEWLYGRDEIEVWKFF